MEHIAIGAREPELLSSLAGRLIRLEKRIEPDVRAEVEKLSGGKTCRTSRATFSTRSIPTKSKLQLGRDDRRAVDAYADSRIKNSPSPQSPPIPISETRSSHIQRARRSNHRHRLARQTPLRRRRRENKRSRARHDQVVPRLHRATQSRDRSAPDSLQPPIQETPDRRIAPRTRSETKTRVRPSTRSDNLECLRKV